MIVNDPIYGAQKITDLVLIDLTNSAPMQRLKHIHQHGANYFYWPQADSMNRYDHCLGVMLLIRKLGGSLEEQVAGLLHDVGHSAFSHVLDYLLDNRNHEAHEEFTEKFVASTQIPAILKKHNLDIKKIFDHTRHSLLEQPAPLLCADRVDYFLRDALGYGVLTVKQIQKIVKHLATHKNMIVTKNKAIAKLIGETYLDMDREYWATSTISLAVNNAVVEIIRKGLSIGIINFDDLWRYSDRELLEHLKSADEPEITRWLSILHPDITVVEDKNNYDVCVYPKIRLIDPPVLVQGKIAPLSEISRDFAKQLVEARQFPEKLFLRFYQ